MQHWNLLEIDAPDGTRDPVVLHSADEARAVMIRIDAGQVMREHQVKERAWICVVEGEVRVEAADEAFDARPGCVVTFDPDERHVVGSQEGARLLLLLSPWPGEGHYRGGGGPTDA